MGIPFTIKIIRNEESKMKKFASAGLSILVATGVQVLGEMKYRQQNKRNQKHLKTVPQNNQQ